MWSKTRDVFVHEINELQIRILLYTERILDFGLIDCDEVYFGRSLQIFLRNVPSPSLCYFYLDDEASVMFRNVLDNHPSSNKDSSHLHGQQDNTGLNKERQKSQPPRRRNQEESSNPERKELENRI
jgi:hypothetical protein